MQQSEAVRAERRHEAVGCFSACSHQLLALHSPGSVLQDRVHHLRRVQLPNLPENKDSKQCFH